MYKAKTIVVVVPCLNEECQIGMVLDTMPDFVDKIVVIDDHSSDNTVAVVKEHQQRNEKIVLIQHEKTRGVGAAISHGYVWARDNDFDVAVVMAGDGQMDPKDLPALLDPVVEDKADYGKGNRLITGRAWQKIPRVRYLGNSGLTMLTKIASGYWHVTDSQSGYTALNKRALHLVPIESIYPDYGMPNDMLVMLNIYDMRVMDVPINPLYGIGEKSGMVIHKKFFPLLFLMGRLFLKRMARKYVIRDFHPLIFFYMTGFLLGFVTVPLLLRLLYMWCFVAPFTLQPTNALLLFFMIIMSLQFLFFAMWFDMDYNRDLNPHR